MNKLFKLPLIISVMIFNCSFARPAASILPKVYYNLPCTGEDVALTFDDGPLGINTPEVLNILKEKNVRATFFLLGENLSKNKEIVKRIVREGHEIGLHTFTHPNLYKLNRNEIKKEIVDNIDLLKSIIGYTPTLIRPPYGIITKTFLSIVKEMNLKVISWSNDSFDWKKENDASVIIENALAKIHPGAIILMHDKSNNYSQSRKALPVIIKNIKSEGYDFLTVSSFFELYGE